MELLHMNKINEIYEAYLKPHNDKSLPSKEYLDFIKVEALFKNSLNLFQYKKYEELEYLMKKMRHQENIELIKFVLGFIKENNKF